MMRIGEMEKTERESIGTYVGILAGGIVSYKAGKQPTVATSSTEGEYMALLQAVKESI